LRVPKPTKYTFVGVREKRSNTRISAFTLHLPIPLIPNKTANIRGCPLTSVGRNYCVPRRGRETRADSSRPKTPRNIIFLIRTDLFITRRGRMHRFFLEIDIRRVRRVHVYVRPVVFQSNKITKLSRLIRRRVARAVYRNSARVTPACRICQCVLGTNIYIYIYKCACLWVSGGGYGGGSRW